jgi:hypothetical protein
LSGTQGGAFSRGGRASGSRRVLSLSTEFMTRRPATSWRNHHDEGSEKSSRADRCGERRVVGNAQAVRRGSPGSQLHGREMCARFGAAESCSTRRLRQRGVQRHAGSHSPPRSWRGWRRYLSPCCFEGAFRRSPFRLRLAQWRNLDLPVHPLSAWSLLNASP